jgi:hypothetical protein
MMDYPDGPYVVYPCGDEFGDAVFIRACENCRRFVKAAGSIFVNEMRGLKNDPNAECKKCGPVKMIFLGFF